MSAMFPTEYADVLNRRDALKASVKREQVRTRAKTLHAVIICYSSGYKGKPRFSRQNHARVECVDERLFL